MNLYNRLVITDKLRRTLFVVSGLGKNAQAGATSSQLERTFTHQKVSLRFY